MFSELIRWVTVLGSAGAVVFATLFLWNGATCLNRVLLRPGYEAKLDKALAQAALSKRPEDILLLQELGFLACGVLGALVFRGPWALALALFGAACPLLWLSDQVKKRHLAISRALPHDLDLLTLSVEAGLDFSGALAKVVEKGRPGPLHDELTLVLRTLKMGKTREEALKAMTSRVALPALQSFVGALVQADRMGTGVGKVLRIQSAQLRSERAQRAEKLANEAPVKMLFPLIACIFPTVFLILFGPIVFAFMFGGFGG
ncbi:MAG: type II secretion system F family protein [Myxococcaceae bacterium]